MSILVERAKEVPKDQGKELDQWRHDQRETLFSMTRRGGVVCTWTDARGELIARFSTEKAEGEG